MKTTNNSSIEQLQAAGRFESLRKILLSGSAHEKLQKPLAYWALPTDRRLPLAFLGRTVEDLLNTPFRELLATPGIGRKKIQSFVALLSRAADTDPSELPVSRSGNSDRKDRRPAGSGSSNGFDPAMVSEEVWAQWRASVLRHGLEYELLGHFAPSLKNMTRVIWSKPLRAYTGLSLAEIRAMKTHGEKRVRAILEVFHGLHGLVGGMGSQDHLVLRISPRLINRVERWIGRILQAPGIPGEDDLFQNFTGPLLEHLRVDSSRQVVRLAEQRLGIGGPIASVRQAARNSGLTRARVYQLLNEMNDIMTVRWPLGRHKVYQLQEKLQALAGRMDDPPDLRQFFAAVELFYPGKRRGAVGPVELAAGG